MEKEIKSGSHLYGRGWFGLIPLIGGFIGIGLMCLGIFKYKNRKLTLIGFIALLFTAAVYGYMFYDLKYSTRGKIADLERSQEHLNVLPKQIELYKMQHDQYPDSLEQIGEKEELFMFYDPLVMTRMERNVKVFYTYRKIGEKYTIFSVGIDGVPNTSDDLYPIISSDDKLNYGFLKHK